MKDEKYEKYELKKIYFEKREHIKLNALVLFQQIMHEILITQIFTRQISNT